VNKLAQVILRSARIEEMRQAALEMSNLCRKPPPIELTKRRNRRLMISLVHERRRNAKLVETING
jgi:hypothetical protein